MRGDVRSLRPLYAEYRDSLSPMCRLACDLTLAEDDSDDRRFVECVDSLTRLYSRLIPATNRSVWEVQKAAALCRLGRYSEAARFCRQRLELMDPDERDSPTADNFRFYEEKGRRYADTVSFRGRLLGAIDRSDLPLVLSLSTMADTARLDPYARLRLQAAACAALNRPSCAASAVDALFRNYTDSLPDAEAGMLFSLAADELAFAGRWTALDSLCARFSSAFGTQHPDLSHYRYLARSFADCPPTCVKRPQGQSFVLTSYDWPLTTDIGVNGRLLPDVIVDTGSPFTLLTRSDAEACGVRLLADTVETGSAFGPVMACTGYADEVTLGEVRLQHIVVLVRLDDASRPGQTPVSLLGLNDLRRIGRVEVLDLLWSHEEQHARVYTDLFRFSGEERWPVTLRLGRLSCNLLKEEYPQAAHCLQPDGDGHWLLSTEVCSFRGVGRFVLGLYEDVEVLGSDEFKAFLKRKAEDLAAKAIGGKMGHEECPRQGFRQGRAEEKRAIARNLKSSGFPLAAISEATGMPLSELEQL